MNRSAPVFSASVGEDGMLRPDDAVRWRAALASMRGKRVRVTVEREAARRSDRANRRYFGAVVPLVQECLSLDLTLPMSKDATHALLCEHFIGFIDTPLGRAPKSSRNLTTPEFQKFVEEIEQWLLTRYGVTVPESDWDSIAV